MSALTGTNKFSADLEGFAEKIDLKVEVARKRVALELFGEVRSRTPVKTGFARAGWDLTAGAPSTRLDAKPNLKEGDVMPLPAVPELGEVDGRESIFIINNLPYIEPLEHGHSGQAPAGMVEPAMAAVAARIDAAIKTA